MMASAALAVDVPNREDGLPKLLDDEELMSPKNLDAEEKRAVKAQQHRVSHLDHPLDEHGKPVVENLYWSFAVILEPKPLPVMLGWLRGGLSRACTVRDLADRSWRKLAEQCSLRPEDKLTPENIDRMVQYATEHKWYDCSMEELRKEEEEEEEEPFANFVIEVAEKIDKAGLRMQLVQRTETSKHNVILLIRCPEDLFVREHKQQCIRRWKATGQGVEFYKDEEQDGLQVRTEPTEADRVQLTAMLLTMDEARGGCGFGNLEHLDDDEDHDPRIVAVFPLHNPEYVETIIKEWKKEASFVPRIFKWAKAPFAACINSAHDDSAEKAIRRTNDSLERVKGHKPSTTAPVLHESYAAAADAKRANTEGETESKNLHRPDAAATDGDLRLLSRLSDALVKATSVRELLVSDALLKAQSVQGLLEAEIAPDVLKSEKKFLKQVQSQYGDRFAFLFAFMQAITEALLWLQLFMAVYFLFIWPLVETTYGATFWDFSADYYRRATGVYGLLVPCVWCPIFLGIWDRHSQHLRREWGVVGATELPILSPFYRKVRDSKWTHRLKQVGFHCVVALSVGLLFVITFLQLEYELITLITPICNSFFFNKVWGPYIAYDATSGNGNSLAFPSCYSGSPATGPLDGWRGLWFTILGIVAGIFISIAVVLFNLMGEWMAKQANKQTWQEYERKLVDITYPLEVLSFNFYPWFLAFVFIPFGAEIQTFWLASAEDGTMIDIYSNHTTNFTLPCKYSGDAAWSGLDSTQDPFGFCDEWRGSCLNNTDSDCRNVGCTDNRAINYDPNADPARSIDPRGFPVLSLDALATPDSVVCQYHTEIDQVSVVTTCPTANDGQCDEPLDCLLEAVLTHPWIADASFAECEQPRPKSTRKCPIGSDTLDCRELAAEVLWFCLTWLPEFDGCLNVMQKRFALDGESPREACEHIKPLDPGGELCAEFGDTWPDASLGWEDSLDGLSVEIDSLDLNLLDDMTRLRATETNCDTVSARQCLAKCDPCVGCLEGVVDRATDGGNMTFCEEYPLCTLCTQACDRYADCFPEENRVRATRGNSCERIGWVNNGWCDAQHEADFLNCFGSHIGGSSWVCDAADDVADCSARCNFGCTDEHDINYKKAVRHVEDACTGKRFSVKHMMKIWLFDKQFISQIDAAIVVPLVLAAVIPFCIEFVLVVLCGMWQRSTRRRNDYTGKSFWLGRCLCCACQKCRCCIVQMNCYMCDRAAQSAAAGTVATTLTDAELAEKITGKVSQPVLVRTKEWNSKHRGLYDAADEIIIQSMLEPIDLKGEFTKQASLVMMAIMWTIVFPFAPLVIMLIVEFRMKSDFVRLTKFARRPIPVKPNDSDATGGHRSWLRFQMFVACILVTLLFCITTGQFEAFATLLDEKTCSPPKFQPTTFKYPGCMDPAFINRTIEETGFDESELTNTYEPPKVAQNYLLVAMNRTCWETVPELPADATCPFDTPESDNANANVWMSSKQLLYRFMCFVLIEHVQFLLIFMISRSNENKAGSTKKSWYLQRLTQHHLVADHVFPAKAEDHVYFEMATQRMAHRLRLRARRKQAKDPDASAPEVAAATTQP